MRIILLRLQGDSLVSNSGRFFISVNFFASPSLSSAPVLSVVPLLTPCECSEERHCLGEKRETLAPVNLLSCPGARAAEGY